MSNATLARHRQQKVLLCENAGDRPFPFDGHTQEVYETGWERRTGAGQLGQVLFRKADDLIAMLAFYGDGSGEHGGRFVLAGYLADTITWFHFEREWEKARKSGPKILDYFKARECLHLDGQFAGWTTEDADAKRLEFAQIIRKYGSSFGEVSASIRWDEYESAIGDGIVAGVFYSPYFFLLHAVVSSTVECSRTQFKKDMGPVAFVFDTESNSKLDDDSYFQYMQARKRLPPEISSRMGLPTWTTDLAFPVLQAADLVAWSIRAAKAGLPSPVLATIREKVGWRGSKDWNGSGLAQKVADLETAVP